MLFWLFVIKDVWQNIFGGGVGRLLFSCMKICLPRQCRKTSFGPGGGGGTSFHYYDSTGGQLKLLTDTTEKRNK